MKRMRLAILIPWLLLSCAENKNMIKEDKKLLSNREWRKPLKSWMRKLETGIPLI